VATARADGGALLVTGKPRVGKTVRLDAASKAASARGTRVLHAAGIQFEAGMSFSGLNQPGRQRRTPMSHNAKVGQAHAPNQVPPTVPQDYLAEVDLEYARWSEIVALIHMQMPEERLAPGYFRDPDWSVKDLVAHLGAWLEEAATQLTNIAARSYEPHDVDIDARNADVLAATKQESWEMLWTHATTARADMLQHWFALNGPSDAANWWVRKAGAEHYGEHLAPLRAWVSELVEARTRPPSDEWDS
jgi:hypothetical protein